jgi:kynureninase
MGKRKKILIEKQAFPSDRYAVQSQLKFHGNDPNDDLILLKPDEEGYTSMIAIKNYLKKYGDEIALVLMGGVNYFTGQAFDVAAITEMTQNCGCRVGFDLAHAAGNLKLNLHDWGVDFAAWCGYKYLNGGPGAPSGVFIHERHLGRTDLPRFEGWWGHDKSTRFQMPKHFKPLQTVEAWQLSNPPILSMAALLSSLEIFHEAGMIPLREKSKKLTSYLESLIKSELAEEIKIITPSSPQHRGCQLSLRLLQPINNITNLLHERGVISDWREPDVLRVTPVPLYNSFEDCYKFVQILK